MSRTRARLTEDFGLLGRTAEQLDQRGPGRREALGHLGGHGGVVHRRLPLERAHPRTDPAGRDDEDRQEHDRHQRDRPGEAQHHNDGEHEHDHVGDDTGQRRREGTLGPDHIVVQAAHQRTGVRAVEERDRHGLHVLEDATPKVQDQVLAESGGCPALQQPDRRVGQRHERDEHGQADHDALRFAVDDGVDGPPGQDRRGDAEHGGGGGQEEERDDGAPVRGGEVTDAPPGVTTYGALRLARLHGAAQHHPRVHVAHGLQARSSSSL